jgi:hypothetical protein
MCEKPACSEAMRKQMRKHAKSHVIEKFGLHALPRCESSCFVQKTTCAEARGSDAEAKCGSKPFINTQAQEFRHTTMWMNGEIARERKEGETHQGRAACRRQGGEGEAELHFTIHWIPLSLPQQGWATLRKALPHHLQIVLPGPFCRPRMCRSTVEFIKTHSPDCSRTEVREQSQRPRRYAYARGGPP